MDNNSYYYSNTIINRHVAQIYVLIITTELPAAVSASVSLSHLTAERSSSYTFSRGAVDLRGRRNSRAWQAASSSMANTAGQKHTFNVLRRHILCKLCLHSEPPAVSPCSTCSTTLRALRAAQPPIDTWSSVAALVDRESTEDGWHRALLSDTATTAVFEFMQTACLEDTELIKMTKSKAVWVSLGL